MEIWRTPDDRQGGSMDNWPNWNRTKKQSTVHFLGVVLLAATLGTSPAPGQTYISAEPIPSSQIVGTANLASIESLSYASRALWGQRLLTDCRIVQNTIKALSDNGEISTVFPGNTRYLVAAGGFQGVTDPSYVLTIQDSGLGAASAADIFVLDNVLGYVLNQGGTAQFGLHYNANNPYEFSNQYAVVTFAAALTGEHAMEFFNYLGTIDPALWTGTDAGFTQINFSNSPVYNYMLNDSMLFLIGDVPTSEFVNGLFRAAITTPNAAYWPIDRNGPTVATAGAAFPGNDWIAYPGGDQYLSNLVNPSRWLLRELAALRMQHLQAVADLLKAIKQGNVSQYLNSQFTCPQR
jgi:hypothetical protein